MGFLPSPVANDYTAVKSGDTSAHWLQHVTGIANPIVQAVDDRVLSVPRVIWLTLSFLTMAQAQEMFLFAVLKIAAENSGKGRKKKKKRKKPV